MQAMGLRLVMVGSVLALALAGCGGSTPRTARPRPVTPNEWKSVIRDWYDGRFDHRHRCAAVRQAIKHLPTSPPAYSAVQQDFAAYEKTVC
jgi:hypothetical protein